MKSQSFSVSMFSTRNASRNGSSNPNPIALFAERILETIKIMIRRRMRSSGKIDLFDVMKFI
jgi:hypothetical protein